MKNYTGINIYINVIYGLLYKLKYYFPSNNKPNCQINYP